MLLFIIIVQEPSAFEGQTEDRIYGPFGSERGAREWADENLIEDWPRRITSMRMPL